MTEQTEGKKRVRTFFNASGTDSVTRAKETYAALINQVLAIGGREAAIAATKIEEAAMWHVKALTAGK